MFFDLFLLGCKNRSQRPRFSYSGISEHYRYEKQRFVLASDLLQAGFANLGQAVPVLRLGLDI